MREYLYNIRMSLKNHGIMGSLGPVLTLTALHLKKLFIRNNLPKKEKIHGFTAHFFSYASLTGLYEEIFIQRQYFFETKNQKPVIMDCGSNIGMAVLYFKKIYPGAVIMAFEPDPDTFLLLKKTVEENGFRDVTVINRALAGKRGKAGFYSDKTKPGNLHMSLVKSRVENADRHKVETDRLSSYIKGKTDFVKMDVEGAEAEVISELDKSGKLKKISLLAVEIHHNITGGKDILNKVTGVLVKNKMKYGIGACRSAPFKAGAYQDMLLFAEKSIGAVK